MTWILHLKRKDYQATLVTLVTQGKSFPSSFLESWCADHCNENKDFTILANQRALLVSKNEEKNLKTIAKTKASEGGFSQKNLFCFHLSFWLRKGTELGND